MPRLRNQDGIEKGISRLRLKLPTSISISAPIYSHRPYKRVCSYIGFPSSFLRSAFLIALISSLFPLSLPSVVCTCEYVFVIADQLILLVTTLIRNVVAGISVHLKKPHLNIFDNPVKDWSQRLENWMER